MSRFGQLLAGAGRVGVGMREEQEARRVAEQNQLALEEMRRADAARREAEAQARQMYQPQPGLRAPMFAEQLGIAQVPSPAAPAAAAPAATQDAPAAQEPSAEQAAAQLGVTDPLSSNIPPLAMQTLQRMAEARGLSMTEIPLDDGFRSAYNYILSVSGPRVSDIRSVLGPIGGRIQEGIDDIPAQRRQAARFGAGTAAGTIAGLGMIPIETALTAAYYPMRGAAAAGLAGLGLATDVGRQIIAPGARPEEAPAVAEAEAQTQKTAEAVNKAETAVQEGKDPSADTAETATAGVQQQTRQILGQEDFFLANPQAVSQEMRNALQQRENLVRLANIYSRAGMGFEHLQTASMIQDLDNNMMYLQGMQGVQELTMFRDPRRLAAVVSEYSGQQINYQPRSDGLYNVVTTGPDGQMRILQEGLGADQIAQQAMLIFSPQARERAAEHAAERTALELELEFFTAQETVKTLNNVHEAIIQGDIDLARTIAGRLDARLEETGDGLMLIRRDQFGNVQTYRYRPEQPEKKRWFRSNIPFTPATFGEFGMTPLGGSSGSLEQTTDPNLLQQALQSWSRFREPGTGE